MISSITVAFLLALAGPADRLELPADGADDVGTFPDLLWSASAWGGVDEVSRYRVQIATDASFADVVVEDAVEIARYVPYDHPLEPGDFYYWRVQCIDESGAAGSWSETNGFSIADFDQWTVNVYAGDSVAAVRSKFAQARNNAPSTVRLMEDVSWASDDEEILNLVGYNNVRFDGNGKTITITNPANQLFEVLNSENMLFEDFSVDYNPLPYVLCEVTDVAGDALTVVTVSNAANPCLELNHPLMVGAQKTHMRLLDRNNPGTIKYGGSTYILDGNQVYDHSVTNSGTISHVIDISGSNDPIETGDYMLRVARGNARNILRSATSERITLNNVTAYASPSQFASCIDGSQFLVLNCSVARKEGRYSSVTADSIYVRRNVIGPWVENCRFEANGDDCLNFHSLGAEIISKVSDNTLEMSVARTLDLCEIGDEVVIWDPRPGTGAAITTMLTAKDVSALTMTFADDVGAINFGDANGFDTVVYTVDRPNSRFCVKDNYIKNNARFGLLVSSRDGVVSGNTFDGCASSAIRIGNTPDEGLCADNVLIQSNTMVQCGYVDDFFDVDGGVVTMNSYAAGWGDSPQQFHQDIFFLNNWIEAWENCAFNLKGAGNVLLDGNVIYDGGLSEFSTLSTDNDLFRLGNLTRVTLTNTVVSERRTYDSDVQDLGDLVEASLDMAFSSTLPDGNSDNLLINGSFDFNLNGWTVTGLHAHNADISVDYASGSMELTQSDDIARMAYQYVDGIEAGADYELTGSIKLPADLTGSGTGAKLVLKFFNGSTFLGFERDDLLSDETEWTEQTIRFTAPAGTTRAKVEAYLHTNSGTVYFDDLKLRKIY